MDADLRNMVGKSSAVTNTEEMWALIRGMLNISLEASKVSTTNSDALRDALDISGPCTDTVKV